MSNATSLPLYASNKFFFWNAKLTDSLDNSTTDQTIYWDTVPVDENGATITGAFLIAVRNTRRNPNRTEMMWVPASAVAADGLSATTVVRGLKPSGIDFTTGSSSYCYEFDSGDEIFCAILPQDGELIRAAIQGLIATGTNNLRVGDLTDSNIKYYAQNADTNKPWFGYDAATNQWLISNDGISSFVPGTGAGAITGGDGISVTAGDIDVDLTDTTVFVQTSSGAGDAGKVARLSAGTGKLAPGFVEPAPFTTYISDSSALVGGATSNADALHTHSGLTAAVVAGEAVNGSSTAQPISLLGNNFKKGIVAPANGRTFFSTLTGTSRAFGIADATTKRGQSFSITDSLATSITLETITLLMAYSVGAPADYMTVEISADSGGFPSSTIIANGTATPIIGSSLSADHRAVKFTFPTPPTLVSGTTYWFALRRSTVGGGASANAANGYALFDAGADVITGNSASYTGSTTTWGSSSTTDFQFILQANIDYDAKGVIADGNAFPRTRFKGFTKSNVSGGGTLAVATEVVDGLTLVGGSEYYLDTTQGALTTTAPALTTTFGGLIPVVTVGYAINTTTLKIEPRYEAVLAISDIYNSGQPITQNAQDSTFDVLIETGFQPREFDIRYTVMNKAAVAADDVYVVTKFLGTTQYPILTSTGAAFAGTLIDTTAITYAVIQAIYENGFLLRIFSTEATAEALGNLQIIAKS